MIFTASFFRPETHHGQPISIDLYAPPSWSGQELKLFAPSQEIVRAWGQSPDESLFVGSYRELIRDRLPFISHWVETVRPYDCTLLTWEPTGRFDHRSLVAKLISHYWPQSWGGEAVFYQHLAA